MEMTRLRITRTVQAKDCHREFELSGENDFSFSSNWREVPNVVEGSSVLTPTLDTDTSQNAHAVKLN